MNYEVVLSDPAKKQLAKLDADIRARIMTALHLLATNPYPPASRTLTGDQGGRMRLRIGSYRIIYSVDMNILKVLVIRIAHRREVYR